mmetsp:Transcript_8232/g.12383  ORF Transcript_8232/g.12383 Transcript_8232/m.12383 type:complete len:300 (-) Transcript_8232:97-996(-)
MIPSPLRRRTTASLRAFPVVMLASLGGAVCLTGLLPLRTYRGLQGIRGLSKLLPSAGKFLGKAATNSRMASVAAFASRPMTAAAFGWGKPVELLEKNSCIMGRPEVIPNAPAKDEKHFLLGNPMYPPFPENMEMVSLGMGCFWCSENLFMRMPGVYSTHVGYAQGETQNPTYEEVCSGRTNHNEVVRVVYDPAKISLKDILKVFWERHDPTTLNQQGNDRGTQYRSGIYYYTEEQKKIAEETKETYQQVLNKKGFGKITTEVEEAKEFFYAETYHQQYDAKPGSRQYCGLSPLGTSFPA